MSALFKSVDGRCEKEETVSVAHKWYHCGNLETSRGRRNNAILILAVALMPVFVMIIQNIVNVYNRSLDVNRILDLRSKILFSTETGNIVHRTQIERGTTALYIGSDGDPGVLLSLKSSWNETDKVILSITEWPETDIPHFKTLQVFHQHIKTFREALDPSVTNINEAIAFYTADNAVMINWVAQSIQNYVSGSLWKTLVSYHLLVLSKEQAGIERALGGTYFAKGGFLQNEMNVYLTRKTLGETYLVRCMEYDNLPRDFLNANYTDTELHKGIMENRNRISNNNDTQPSVALGTTWFNNMTKYINLLKHIQDSLANKIITRLDNQISDLEEGLVGIILVMVFAILLTPFVIFCIHRLTSRIQAYANTLREKSRDLDQERKRSQNILYELLPESVAKRMINNEPIKPEAFSCVTIFFSDIVGFTRISSQISPIQVVDMLNLLYVAFDNRLELYDVYKVETIGDAYMVVSGLPVRNGDKHAPEIASLALDLLDTISLLSVPHLPNEKLHLRIGLNTGPVVAGVVGHKMPRYCLFGDTVNTASRMESSSLPLHIQISESTKTALMIHGGFHVRQRGQIEIKGKGVMTTFWLIGRNGEHKVNIPENLV